MFVYLNEIFLTYMGRFVEWKRCFVIWNFNQVILDGEETIGFALDSDLAPVEEYSEENDVVFLESPKDASVLVMRPGYFAVFYPHDIHHPIACCGSPKRTAKSL